ncbi:MAG TPA: hypothetical protein VMU31_04295 [Rhizomicrobium sp.]|nr:hypothetical protein [Rhizomicrobium sp.]
MKMCALALVLAAAGLAPAHAGTNFPALADYPAPNCGKTEKPVDIPAIRNGEDPVAYNKRIKQHNDQVARYNTALHDYTACMNDYVTNAQADMNLIRDRANDAVHASQTPN